MDNFEIERKFLAVRLPELEAYPSAEIRQAYISTEPVIRIRQYGEKFFLTIKSEGLLSREEREIEITKINFDKLSIKAETPFLSKTRYLIPIHDGLTAELDVYGGGLSGLFTVEVEFPDIETAKHFLPPAWFGEEITHKPEYSNNRLITDGMPR